MKMTPKCKKQSKMMNWKIEAMESEVQNTPFVLKDVEILEVCRGELLAHTQLEDRLQPQSGQYHLPRENSKKFIICSGEKETRTTLIKGVVIIGDIQ